MQPLKQLREAAAEKAVEDTMQWIRETLVSSSLAFAITAAGVAVAEGGETRSRASEPETGAAHARSQSGAAPRAASSGEERVMSAQRALSQRGLYKGRVDGIAGPQTEAAVREFQFQNGLAPTGQLNLSTANALGLGGERQPVAGTDAPQSSGQRATLPARGGDDARNVPLSSLSANQTKEMQQRLRLLGYYRGEIDGIPGSGTRAALESFFRDQAELAARGEISNAAISLFGTDVSDIPPAERAISAPPPDDR